MKLGEIVQKSACCLEEKAAKVRQTFDPESKVMKVAKIVTAVAVGLLSVLVAPIYFLPFFAAGVGLGIYTSQRGDLPAKSCSSGGACGQAFYDDLTGMQIPYEASFVFAAAITLHHIIECGTIFACLAGVRLGGMAGREIYHIYDRYRNMELVY